MWKWTPAHFRCATLPILEMLRLPAGKVRLFVNRSRSANKQVHIELPRPRERARGKGTYRSRIFELVCLFTKLDLWKWVYEDGGMYEWMHERTTRRKGNLTFFHILKLFIQDARNKNCSMFSFCCFFTPKKGKVGGKDWSVETRAPLKTCQSGIFQDEMNEN